MSVKTNNFKLGLFTLAGVGLLALGVLAFGAWSSLERKSLYETYLPGDVSGLSLGSAVEFRGVGAGKVVRIGFSWNEYQDSQPGSVVVVFEMRDDVFAGPPGEGRTARLKAAVDRGLRARLKARGVTGACIVSLEYLDPEANTPMKIPWTPRHAYIPSAPGLLGDLLVSLQKTLHRFERLDLDALGRIAAADLESIGRVLDRLEKMGFDGIGTNANALLVEIRRTNVRLGTFIDDTDGVVKKLPLEKLARDADALVGQLRETVAKLRPGLASLDFDAVNQTLAQARQALRDLDDALNELKQYPSGFILGRPPARLKEVQPANKNQ